MVDTPAKVQTANDLPEHLQIKDATTVATRGEKFTHKFAHKFINFGLNYILSVSITDLSLGSKDEGPERPTSYIASLAGKGKFGQAISKFSDKFKYFHDEILSNGTYKLLGGKFEDDGDKKVKNSVLPEKIGDIVADVFTLMLGGHITATIATWIQNRTDKFARRFDNMFDSLGGKEVSEEEKAQREARYAYLAEQPKVSAWTTAKARGVGFIANLITGSGTAALHKAFMNKNRRLAAETPDSSGLKENLGVRAITSALGNKVVGPLFNGISSAFIDPTKDYGGPTGMRARRVKFWSEMALFEGVCTLNTSMAHMILTDRKQHGKKDDKKPVTTKQDTAASNRNDVKDSIATASKDESAAPSEGKAGSKKAWADERVAEKGDVKTHDERRQEQSTNVHAFA